MANRLDLKKIVKEDFSGDDQKLIDKLAFPINSFMEQTQSALDGNLNFQNLNREPITLDLAVDTDGVPTIATQYRSNLNTKVLGHNCIAATNITTPGEYPLSNPFINFTQNGALVRILQISGLQPNKRYKLVLESIGT